VSTLLQLLVSVQGLVLIEHPYCNEPGQERDGGSAASVEYSKQVQAGVMDNMIRMSKEPPIGCEAMVQSFLQREGAALLQRARTLPNELVTDEGVQALDKALRERALPGAGGVAVKGKLTPAATLTLPSWLIVAEETFTSGYVKGEDSADDDY
jgi:hypothetical protein